MAYRHSSRSVGSHVIYSNCDDLVAVDDGSHLHECLGQKRNYQEGIVWLGIGGVFNDRAIDVLSFDIFLNNR